MIRDEQDEECGSLKKLLINGADISFEGLWELVASYGGIMFPAHIEKSSNSLLSNLGFVADDSKFTWAEVHDLSRLHELKASNPYLEGCGILHNSDAHYLYDIKMPRETLVVAERSAKGVLEALKGRKHE